jgi:hypothetical protein
MGLRRAFAAGQLVLEVDALGRHELVAREELLQREVAPVHQGVDLLHAGGLHVHHELVEHLGGDAEVAEVRMHAQGVDGRGAVGNAELAEEHVTHDEAGHLAVDFADDGGVDVGRAVENPGDLALVVFLARLAGGEGIDGDDRIQVALAQHAQHSFLIRHFFPPLT